MNFTQYEKIGSYQYQFCSNQSKLIVELSREPGDSRRYQNARVNGFDMLSYESLIWEEFPEIVVEDMLAFLLTRERTANPV